MSHDKLVYRILAGCLRINIAGETYIIKGNTIAHKYLAEELYESLRDKYNEDLLSDDDLYDWLIANKYWSFEEDEKLKTFKKNLEEFQVKLFELGFKGREKQITKKAIAHTRSELRRLNDKRHVFDNLSASGAATLEKNKYLVGLSICDERGNALFNEFNFYGHSFSLLDKVILEINKQSITVAEYRKMARSEPWRQYWGAKDGTSSVFNCSSADLTEEQLNLISWTRLYDSVFSHPKCPDDSIIEDDDCLDGFLIKDRREREKESGPTIEDIVQNEKIRGSEEVYVALASDLDVEPTAEEGKAIYEMNSEQSKAIMRQRNKFIKEKGTVNYSELPDVRQRLQMEINKASLNR